MHTINGIELDAFTVAYLTCALWAETDNATDSGGEPLDANYGLEDFTPEALQHAKEVCVDFRQLRWKDQQTQSTTSVQSWLDSLDRPHNDNGAWDEMDGHDFWLTRNGHGAGFWDRGYGRIGDVVTAACKTFGSEDVYVGDDGKLHFA